MMKPFRLRGAAVVILWLLLITLNLYGPASAQRDTGPGVQPRSDAHAIMISIDGLVPDYYTARTGLGPKMPNLIALKRGGAYADGVEGIYPTVTYPAHTTLITGVRPAIHGIVQNRVFEAPTDRSTRAWYWFADALKSETLWTLAKKAGMVTAAVGWPVTVGAQIDYNVPEIWDPAEKPITWKRSIEYSTPELLEKAIGLGGGKPMSGDERRTVVSEFIIENYRPHLMLIHLIELDDAHHSSGPYTDAARQTAEREDRYIGRIVAATRKAGIFSKTTFLVVSDHGFASIDKKFEPNVVLVKEKLITLDTSGKPVAWKAAAWPAGGSCAIVLRDAKDKETAAQVTALFSEWASHNNGPIIRVINRDELDRLGAIPEAFLMLEAAPGYSFDEALTGPEVHDSGMTYRGTHGYLPTRAEMRAALIISGRGARRGARIPLARMIDIAPTAAALLGLSFSNAEGKPIAELLKPGRIPHATQGQGKEHK